MKRKCSLLFIFMIVLGFMCSPSPKVFVNGWWSVIYPEFYQSDIRTLPESERLEIRWRSQEAWQNLLRKAQAPTVHSTASTAVSGALDLP